MTPPNNPPPPKSYCVFLGFSPDVEGTNNFDDCFTSEIVIDSLCSDRMSSCLQKSWNFQFCLLLCRGRESFPSEPQCIYSTFKIRALFLFPFSFVPSFGRALAIILALYFIRTLTSSSSDRESLQQQLGGKRGKATDDMFIFL